VTTPADTIPPTGAVQPLREGDLSLAIDDVAADTLFIPQDA
jgi:hypothetical protein